MFIGKIYNTQTQESAVKSENLQQGKEFTGLVDN